MKAGQIKYSEGEELLGSYLGLNLTTKRIIRFTKNYYDCIYLNKIDSVAYLMDPVKYFV